MKWTTTSDHLELDTDGSVQADDAVATAAKILISCFENFSKVGISQAGTDIVKDDAAEAEAEPDQDKVNEDARKGSPD